MFNKLSAFLTVLILSVAINAQTFSLNFNGAVPTGDFGNSVNLGYNSGVSFHLPVKGFILVASGAYGFWDESGKGFSFTNFPIILVGARQYYSEKFYLTTLAGIYPVKLTVETEGDKKESKETQGAVSAGFGYLFPVSFFQIDANVNYLWTQDYAQIQFGVGFLFNK